MIDLFDEVRIGTMTAGNHFIRSATFEGKATEEGYPTDAVKKIYEDLGRAKVGTIITSYTYITDYEQPRAHQLGIYKDEMIPAYRELTAAVHELGSRIVMQIVHGSSWSQGYPETARILGPSGGMHPESGLVSHEMTKEEIQEVIRLFAAAAGRVKAAGFDGVQIHCAHGYLLAQFISPLFNHRTDEYGGSTENRFRIVREVYDAVRREVGADYPVWIKMNSSDECPDGLTNDEFIWMAEELSKAGMDAIEVSGEKWNTHRAAERAYYKEAAAALAERIDSPVILTGGLREYDDLKRICENSRILLFGFSRPFMTNPDFMKQMKAEANMAK